MHKIYTNIHTHAHTECVVDRVLLRVYVRCTVRYVNQYWPIFFSVPVYTTLLHQLKSGIQEYDNARWLNLPMYYNTTLPFKIQEKFQGTKVIEINLIVIALFLPGNYFSHNISLLYLPVFLSSILPLFPSFLSLSLSLSYILHRSSILTISYVYCNGGNNNNINTISKYNTYKF